MLKEFWNDWIPCKYDIYIHHAKYAGLVHLFCVGFKSSLNYLKCETFLDDLDLPYRRHIELIGPQSQIKPAVLETVVQE